MKSGVRTRPLLEARLNGMGDVIERRKELVVQATPSKEFPDAFDGIELRTVRRQKVEMKMRFELCSPGRVQGRMVITSVIADDHDAATRAATQAFEFPQEIPAGLGIKHSFRARHEEFAIGQAYGAEIADGFARWGVPTNRIDHFRWNPQAATRAMLLKVYLIHGPQIHVASSGQAPEFFYAQLALAGRLERLAAAACASESPVGEISAGTV